MNDIFVGIEKDLLWGLVSIPLWKFVSIWSTGCRIEKALVSPLDGIATRFVSIKNARDSLCLVGERYRIPLDDDDLCLELRNCCFPDHVPGFGKLSYEVVFTMVGEAVS